jgi:hypothetical protein
LFYPTAMTQQVTGNFIARGHASESWVGPAGLGILLGRVVLLAVWVGWNLADSMRRLC